MKNRIAISFEGADCLRVIPISTNSKKAEVKFHFLDNSFTVRKYEKNNSIADLVYLPFDHGKAEHEITYHNANERFQNPVLLQSLLV